MQPDVSSAVSVLEDSSADPSASTTTTPLIVAIKDKAADLGLKDIADKASWIDAKKIIDARLRCPPSYPSASHTTADDPTFSSTSAGNPDLGILSSSTSCCRSTSINHKGVKTIQLPKLILALLANPPAHSTAFAFLKSWPASSLFVADIGATDHMTPHKSAFISYKPATGRRIRMGNNSFAPILGTSSAIISINGKLILIRN
jgi:hypothetical protein